MAIIGKGEIISSDAVKELEAMLDVTMKVKAELIEFAKISEKKLNSTTITDKTKTKELIDYTNSLEKAKIELNEINKNNKLGAQLTERLRLAQEGQNDAVILARTELQRLNKEKKQEARETLGLVGAYEKQSRKLNELRKRYKDLIVEEGKATKETNELLKEITKLDKELKEIDESAGQYQRSVGGYERAFNGLRGSLLSIKNILGGAIVAGFVKLGSVLFKTRIEIEKTESIAKSLFSDTGEDVKKLSVNARALAKSFDKDVNEVLKTANVLSEQFGVEGNKALSLIQEGIEKGADINGDFLDQISEYSTQFRLAGLSAEESIAIITQQVREGVFSDKGADAIKEATLALREFTPATKKAIEAIGIDTIKLQKDLNSGAKTYFEAMQEIVAETKKFGEESTEAGAILADVFKGAGEDAGDFIFKLDEVGIELSDLEDTTGDLESASNNLSSAWSRFIDNIINGDSALSGFISKALNQVTRLIETVDTTFSSRADNAERRLNKAIINNRKLTEAEVINTKRLAVAAEGFRIDLLSKRREALDKINKDISKLQQEEQTRENKAQQERLKNIRFTLSAELEALKFRKLEFTNNQKQAFALGQLLSGAEKRLNRLNKEFDKSKNALEGFGGDVRDPLVLQQIESLADATVIVEQSRDEITKILSDSTDKDLKVLSKSNLEQFTLLVQAEQARRLAIKDSIDKEIKIRKEGEKKINKQLKIDFNGIRAESISRYEVFNKDILEGVEETGESLVEAYNQQLKERAENFEALNRLGDHFAEREAERLQEKLRQIETEIQASRDKEATLRALAAQGSEDATNNIAFEQKRRAELEAQRQKAIQKQKRLELGLAALKNFSARLEAGDGERSLPNTISDIIGLSSFISGLATFWEGAENVGEALGKPQLRGKDGHIVRVDGSERILTGEQNKKVGNLSNSELADVGELYNKGLLDFQPDIVYNTNWSDNKEVLAKFDALEKAIKQNAPPKVDYEFDKFEDIVTQIVKSKNKVIRTRSKLKGIW